VNRSAIAGGAFGVAFVLFGAAAGPWAPAQDVGLATATTRAARPASGAAYEGLLYGRVTTDDGTTYEGRLRWGGDEEALWGNYFNGFKDANPWAVYAPLEQLPKERVSIRAFGIELAGWDRQVDLGRPFMARFGDIARIEPHGRDVRVTLKSGTVVVLDRYAADDLADGVRVWDGTGGFVDLTERRIRTIELLPTTRFGAAPPALYGTVRTREGQFTGLVQWDREQAVGSDALDGRAADGELSLRFDTLRSIARRSRDSSLVTLLDGSEIVLSGRRGARTGNRGIYVDDARYGRVLVSWNAFERVDFGPGGIGPAYGDFPPGRPLMGSVVTRSRGRLAGRLVYDLDESESTETLDAPSQGVDYTIPFGLIASIVPSGVDERLAQRATVTLHGGEVLQLEPTGDLGAGNAGTLIFIDGGETPEYVPWADVERVDFDRPPETYPPGPPR
jgi:hypothetical protein